MALGVAIVGYGWWGRHIADRVLGHSDMELAGVVEPQAALRREIADRGLTAWPDLDAALADRSVTAVILTSPNDLHDGQVAACAAAGRHVFCEKPLSLTPEGARRSVAACAEAGLVLGIGHERRFEPAIQALKRQIDSGALGTIMHAELAFSHNKLAGLPSGTWRTSKATAPAAGMTQMGIHLTDLLIWFFGPVTRVHALTADRSLGWETGDVVTVQLRFAAGMTATLQAILNTPHFLRTHVFGTEAWVEIRNATHPDTPGGESVVETSGANGARDTETLPWTDSVLANLDAFAAAVRGEAAYPYSAQELVHNIEVLDAIVISAAEDRAVRL